MPFKEPEIRNRKCSQIDVHFAMGEWVVAAGAGEFVLVPGGESHSIRAAAVQKKVTYYTTMPATIATSYALDHLDGGTVNRLQDLHAGVVQ